MMKEIYYREMLTLEDLIYAPFYIVVLIFLAFLIRGYIIKNDSPIRRYFIPGLIAKFIGAIMVGIIYYFVYHGGGDSAEYYNNAIVMYGSFIDSPVYFWHLLMSTPTFNDPLIQDYYPWLFFHKDGGAYFFGKICGLISLISLDVYTCIALILAFVTYSGVWALYYTFCKIYPTLYKQFAFAVLGIPTIFFWGSGILKDSVTFCCVGWIVYASYNLFIMKRKPLINLIILFLFSYLCLILKAYIIISLAPAIILWILFHYRAKISSKFVRVIFGPLTLGVAGAAGYGVVLKLGSEFKTYSFQGALDTAQSFQDWHTVLAEGGASGYSLGYMDGSALNIISKIPFAINVTLFRPYLWETRNPVMLISAIESTVIMIITIRLLWQVGIINFFRYIFKNPTIIFCMFYSLFFAFCVGFTAYNFGALVRYKVPCVPFFVAGLSMLYYETKEFRENKRKSNLRRKFYSNIEEDVGKVT